MFFFKPENLDDLINFLKENNTKMPITVIGAGSNLIIRDGGVEGAVIKLGRNFTEIELINTHLLSTGAGCFKF
jgi:UDP-N-acetylmuramate dehydrogenase